MDKVSQSQPVLTPRGQTEAAPSAAFTPGPLSYCDGSLDMGPGDPGHAHPWEVYVPHKQATAYCGREADARLYAAAPDLLASLRELKECFRFALLSTTPAIARDGMEFVRKAEAAIAKALGQQGAA